MKNLHAKRTVLVPVFGGDITADALVVARSLLNRADTRLVLVHVAPATEGVVASPSPSPSATLEPRWHRLASAVPPERTFVDAVLGDPVREVLAVADRCRSDVIVLGSPSSAGPADRWIERAIARLLRVAPRRVCLAAPRDRPNRKRFGGLPLPNAVFSPRRSNVARPPFPFGAHARKRDRHGTQ